MRFAGIGDAKPAPGVIEAITDAEVVVLCPSNPVVSLAPMLTLSGVRDALREHPKVFAVSPIVGGRAVKGPADKMLPSVGAEVSAAGVARLYADFCKVFVVDRSDHEETALVGELGLKAVAIDTLMTDRERSLALANSLLEL